MFDPNVQDPAQRTQCVATFFGVIVLMVAAAPLVCWSMDAVFRLLP